MCVFVFVLTQDCIQVHLKGERGPIMVLTCDIGAGDVSGEKSSCFLTLEESRIKTTTLHTGNKAKSYGLVKSECL